MQWLSTLVYCIKPGTSWEARVITLVYCIKPGTLWEARAITLVYCIKRGSLMGSHRLSIAVCFVSSDPAPWLHLPGHNATVPSSFTAWQLHASSLLNNFTEILFPRVGNVAHLKSRIVEELIIVI